MRIISMSTLNVENSINKIQLFKVYKKIVNLCFLIDQIRALYT